MKKGAPDAVVLVHTVRGDGSAFRAARAATLAMLNEPQAQPHRSTSPLALKPAGAETGR